MPRGSGVKCCLHGLEQCRYGGGDPLLSAHRAFELHEIHTHWVLGEWPFLLRVCAVRALEFAPGSRIVLSLPIVTNFRYVD